MTRTYKCIRPNELKDMTLQELIDIIESMFKTKKQKYSQVTWELRRWNNGYWSINVIDDWHKWFKKGIEERRYNYHTPKLACIRFLEFIFSKEINLSKLQSK